MMGDDMHKLSRSRFERGDFGLNGRVGITNPGSRKIYLTFPADSTFKEEDVSNYFRYYWFEKFKPRCAVEEKMEEQADLQQAIELQSRRLLNLQLLDVKRSNHHRALSLSAVIPSPPHSPGFFNQNMVRSTDFGSREENGFALNNGSFC